MTRQRSTWPAAMVSFPAPAVISSMTWSIEVDALPTDADAWFLQRSAAEDSAEPGEACRWCWVDEELG